MSFHIPITAVLLNAAFDDASSIDPGATSLMAFEVAPYDTSSTAALVQFGSGGGYFKVDESAFGGDAADGGTDSKIIDASTGDDTLDASMSDNVTDAGTGGDASSDNGNGAHGSAGSRRITLSYMIDPAVCDKLRDTVYQIKVIRALTLPSACERR